MIIGKKIGMTRIFDENGRQVPVTLVLIEKNFVTQIKTLEKDGYSSVQIGSIKKNKINKPEQGHLKNLPVKISKLKEFQSKATKEINVGDESKIDVWSNNDKIRVSAISKGRGFSGTVKRHHFHLGPKTHGSNNYRQPGSIGSMYPQRVIKGRKMAGRLGFQKNTISSKIEKIDLKNQIIYLKGAIPGPKKGIVYLWK